jgi:type I restriction enzyme, R subunit
MSPTPEEEARDQIDGMLDAAGWVVQDAAKANIHASRGVVLRNFPLKSGHGFADYLLYVDGSAAGVVEAKKVGATLTGVEIQSTKYSLGLPTHLPAQIRPLPFCYESTGVETRFTNRLDPDPRSRQVFSFHRPECLAGWIAALATLAPLPCHLSEVAIYKSPLTVRAKVRTMPPLITEDLWPPQIKAIRNLEQSLAEDRPRALIQMATGSGKTFTAVTAIYRLIKFAGARRVLFLVDRDNLAKQAENEFRQYRPPDDARTFAELYNIQRLQSNVLDPIAKVCITTIQRLYSMLKGEPGLDPALEEGSQFDTGTGLLGLAKEPVPVTYNPTVPIETFDIIITDECHRSIYHLWRQVLEYFDGFIIGLTATPSKQTLGFFNQNLVMEYNHEQAVADGVNVSFDVYRIRTRITESGSTVEAGLFVDKRDRETRAVRWERLDEGLTYDSSQLDRDVVAKDQIRTVVQTFKQKLFMEIFPGRTDVPKTLIYAKDDSHADDIVQIVREEFGKGNDFAQKITYRTGTARVVTKAVGPDGVEVEQVAYKSTGIKSEDLLSAFRNSYYPRIAVTVDMIATGTDIKSLEIVMFLRAVRSRTYFEQMKGRGVRVMHASDFQAVTPDAKQKDHFVIVDCVGVCEQDLADTQPLERQPAVSFEKLLQAVAFGNTDPEVISSLAGRLARMDRRIGKHEREALAQVANGTPLQAITADLIAALDPDRQIEAARTATGLQLEAAPTAAQISQAAQQLIQGAAAPIASNPTLRQRLIDLHKTFEQTIDTVSKDVVLEATFSAEAKEKAKGLVTSFEQFITEHKDEITALQVLYSRPYKARLRFEDIKVLADAIQAPPRAWTPEALWRAYETLDKSKVRGAGAQRILTDIVSLVHFALHHEPELIPFSETVHGRFATWLSQQEHRGRHFTDEQRHWLELIRDHVAGNLKIEIDDFGLSPLTQRGGIGKAYQVFGETLVPLLDELNQVLIA